MDIHTIKGLGGVDRGPERPARSERPGGGEPRPASSGSQDSAAISPDGRVAHERVDALAERARREDADRAAKVAAAQARLEAGALATPEVFEATARRMLAGGF